MQAFRETNPGFPIISQGQISVYISNRAILQVLAMAI